MLISFAWTTVAFLAGVKICTRRKWNDDYAEKIIEVYKRGESVDAWDKLPRAGGKKIGQIELAQQPFKQRTGEMTLQDYKNEGLDWMEQQGLKIQGLYPHEFFNRWVAKDEDVWVIKFKRIS